MSFQPRTTSKVAGRVLARTPDGRLFLYRAGSVELHPALSDNDLRPGDLARLSPKGWERVFANPYGEWPPSRDTAGHDLARFDTEHWRRLQQRADLLHATRLWFRQAGFLEVETPLLVPSAGTELHLDPVAADLVTSPGRPAQTHYLITSPEYAMKRLLAAGSPPIWQLCKVFRDGERGGNHRPEFSMIEWYRPWVENHAPLMADCESLLRTLAGKDSLNFRGRTFDLTPPWPRLRFFDLLRERADIAHPEDLDFDALLLAHVERVEPTLGLERPEFLCDWPIEMASLARPNPENPRCAERFELYLGTLELANAFAELTDPAEQRRRCLAENEARAVMQRPEMPIDEDFLGALERGLPPSAGIAMGFDRLVMVLTDAKTIDDVLTF